MGLKRKSIAVATSLIIVSSAVTAQASSVIALQQAGTICAGGFGGCVLPAKNKPAPVAPKAPAAPAAPAVEEASEKGFSALIPLIFAAGAVVAGVIIASDSDDDLPASP